MKNYEVLLDLNSVRFTVSAEDVDFMTFDTDNLTNAQMDLLENDPTEFYFAISSNDWGCLEEEEASV